MILASVALAVIEFVSQTPSRPKAAASDFEFFRIRVQPIFLARRPGHARCYVCHSIGTNFRLQRLSPGASEWNEDQSRLNYDAVQREVTPGQPTASPLLLHPLTAEAGGDTFHSGGKHWDSQDSPEWRTLAEWVRGQKLTK
jgi:hypothetical protein